MNTNMKTSKPMTLEVLVQEQKLKEKRWGLKIK